MFFVVYANNRFREVVGELAGRENKKKRGGAPNANRTVINGPINSFFLKKPE